VIQCPPSLCGATIWSCSNGLPPCEYLGQKLTMLFGDSHRKHWPVERWLLMISVETHGAGGRPKYCPLPSNLPCLFDTDWPDRQPPLVSAGSEMDPLQLHLPPLEDVSVGCSWSSCCYCCCCCRGFSFATYVTAKAAASSKNSLTMSNLPQAGVIGASLFLGVLGRPAQVIFQRTASCFCRFHPDYLQ